MSIAPYDAPPRPARQWLMIAGVFAVLCAILFAWYFVALRNDYAVLYRDLRPQEAAAIVAQLDSDHTPYRLSEGGATISVKAAEADAIRLKLTGAGIGSGPHDGFELFDNSDMGLTEFAQKIRYQRALQGELTRTIMMMEGVVEARVHILIPERGLFRGDRPHAEAAVTLVTRTPGQESPAQIEGIQRLVAASVADLSASDVVVLDARGEVISATPQPTPIDGALQSLTDARPSRLQRTILAIGRALPGLRFEVSIGHVQSSELAGAAMQITSSAAQETPPPQGPPSALIRIATEDALSAPDIDAVRSELEGDDLIRAGDNIEFHDDLAPLPQPEPTPTRLPVAAEPVEDAQPASIATHETSHAAPAIAWTSPLLLALLGVPVLAIIGFIVLGSRARAMSPAERLSFAAELKEALQLEDQGAMRG